MRYLIYIRVSTLKQDEETQLEYCMRFIKQREKGEFQTLVFRDKVSSKKPLFKREGGAQLLDNLRKGDIVIAMRLDRVSRRLNEITQLIDIFDKKEVEIFLVEQPGIKNKIMLGIYAGMAEEEVKLLGERIKEKMNCKKAKGQRVSRFLPYGYALHETKLVPIRNGDEIVMKRGVLVPLYEEQQVLKLMYQYADNGWQLNWICKALKEAGHLNREGKPFQPMTILRILNRRDKPIPQDQALAELESDLALV